ncbi:helicase-related protein [Halomicronema hongdechloris]|uniref:helicase-related protein n=1 Tax=Halomicronema hongdechloris TaxID=1209493 RepID=UPI000B4D38A0|nr:helicase-related protein [Halomicronema hongdechloris]
MPRIFDNIEQHFHPALCSALGSAYRADFCVGYFNLRGWDEVDSQINQFAGGEGACCRLLIGMNKLPQEELYESRSLLSSKGGIDNRKVIQLKKRIAQEFRQQLAIGIPSDREEAALRKLSAQIRAKKLVVKLFLKHSLHAKLYLVHRQDAHSPIVGFLGSSNLTFSGLSYQGELNVDVLDHDACEKLQRWFDDRWNEYWCFDISEDLADLIDSSWAREQQPPPYHIYLKIAYHLSQEARAGLSEYRIPRDIDIQLFEFQKAAVQIAAHHVNRRGGVLIGDVVGLGKTLVGATLARILQDDFFLETLIICPKNLVSMWQDYVDSYRLLAKMLSISRVQNELPELRRYRVVLIDESHNLRNREGKRYRAIQEYVAMNECRCILLSATPYNKTYLDLSAQLQLFVSEDKDLGIRPEGLLDQIGGELEFIRKHQAAVRSLRAFELSEHADDWHDLMKLYMVRRTRSFIQNNYAEVEEQLPLEKEWQNRPPRKYLEFPDGRRAYFPERQPKTLKFQAEDESSPYAVLYSEAVVEAINGFNLPRYGLGNYAISTRNRKLTADEERQLKGLSRAGKRLMGFSRTNLYKRLESGGPAFIQSLDRHILRNYIFLHAIEQGLDLPIGSQEASLLDTRNNDEDTDALVASLFDVEAEDEDMATEAALDLADADYRQRAAEVYEQYATRYKRRFKWIKPALFKVALKKSLLADAQILTTILKNCGTWQATEDTKLTALIELLTLKHPDEKVLIFTQFADTARYLTDELKRAGIEQIEGVTGDSDNPAAVAWRFSPRSNHKPIPAAEELRVLVATDVLSEGLNLQDCAIIVNYDLPWAIIRLIQRAGRVDRIGQTADQILCYSFLPVEGVERIIRLRSRLRQRLQENAEVVGTDEAFFEDDMDEQTILDLYHEKSGILDGEADSEVDLTSEAYQIWKNAIDADPTLKPTIENLPPVIYSTRAHAPTSGQPEGVLVYLKTPEGNDALALIDREGKSITQSQLAILRLAQCESETPAIPKDPDHHKLVSEGVKHILKEEKSSGGQLGRPSGARFRTYERLKRHAQAVKGTLFESQDLLNAIDLIYRHPLRQTATDQLNRQLKSGIDDHQLADLVVALYQDERLCLVHESESDCEPQIICSMGLFQAR